MSARTPLTVALCTTCDRTAYPPRVACAGCGGRAWSETVVRSGVLEQATVLRRVAGAGESGDAVALGTVRLESGIRIVARIAGRPDIGAPVSLSVDGGAVRARRIKAKKWWKGA